MCRTPEQQLQISGCWVLMGCGVRQAWVQSPPFFAGCVTWGSHLIFQVGFLIREMVTISVPGLVKCSSFRLVQLFVNPWTVACRAPLSMGFSRQEYWSGLPFPSPGDLPDPGIKPASPALQADSLWSEPPGKPKTSVLSKILAFTLSPRSMV